MPRSATIHCGGGLGQKPRQRLSSSQQTRLPCLPSTRPFRPTASDTMLCKPRALFPPPSRVWRVQFRAVVVTVRIELEAGPFHHQNDSTSRTGPQPMWSHCRRKKKARTIACVNRLRKTNLRAARLQHNTRISPARRWHHLGDRECTRGRGGKSQIEVIARTSRQMSTVVLEHP